MKQKLDTAFARLKTFVTSRCFPFVAYGLLMLAVHLLIEIGHGDDGLFPSFLKDTPTVGAWLELLKTRYKTWSSRIVIEAILFILVHFRMLWRFLDTLVMLLITILLSLIFNEKKSTSVNWAIVLLVLAFPFDSMSTAGWIATTVNYSWPLAFGLFALLPITNAIKGKKTKLWITLLSFPALLFAANQEQMCAALLALFGILTVALWTREKRIPWLFLAQTMLCIASMLFILTCPGNAVRSDAEIIRWFPEYAQLSLLHKFEIGYSSSVYEFVMRNNPIFLAFCALLAAVGITTHQKASLRAISCIPLAAYLVFGQLPDLFEQLIPNIVNLNDKLTVLGTGFSITSPTTWLPDMLLTLVIACVLIALFTAFEDKKQGGFSCLLFLIGLATRVVMGFSPTVWASSTRTFLFMYFSQICLSIILFNTLSKHIQTSKKRRLLTLVGIGIFATVALDGVLPFLVA